MPGKAASPSLIAEVVALREVGFTVATIADRTGVSPSTVARIVARHGARKGTASAELVADARAELRNVLRSDETIADEAARMIADDLAHARLLRERLLVAADHLRATNLQEAAVMMRAAAALSTALKNTSDMVRHSLGYERMRDAASQQDLPILTVQVISDTHAARLRSASI